MKYWFMGSIAPHGVQRMCRVIGASRSGYYEWEETVSSKRQKENEENTPWEIKESHKNSRRAYGSPRILPEDLQAKGMRCGENQCGTLNEDTWHCREGKKKFKATTNSKHNLPVAENLLNQTLWQSPIRYGSRILRILRHWKAGCTWQ